MTNLVTLTESNFKKTIEENEFVIVDFWNGRYRQG